MRDDFLSALREHQAGFGLEIPEAAAGRLAEYYELVGRHNPLLHLVAPCPPEEFAVRHILESLSLLEFLPKNASFADVGPGAGLPSIPCLMVRGDLRAALIESKEKKARFLEEAVRELALHDRATVVNRQFEEVSEKPFAIVTCRALDRFVEKLPRLLKWAGQRKLLLFGGESLGEALAKAGRRAERRLMPMSERRYLFIADPPDRS